MEDEGREVKAVRGAVLVVAKVGGRTGRISVLNLDRFHRQGYELTTPRDVSQTVHETSHKLFSFLPCRAV